MAIASTVDTVTAALVALFDGSTSLDGVTVTDGPQPELKRRALYSYGATDWTQTLDDLEGGQSETYHVQFAIRSTAPGNTAAEARTDGFAIFNAVQTLVAANPSVTSTAVADRIVARDHAVSPLGDEGYAAVILFAVAVEAFI